MLYIYVYSVTHILCSKQVVTPAVESPKAWVLQKPWHERGRMLEASDGVDQ